MTYSTPLKAHDPLYAGTINRTEYGGYTTQSASAEKPAIQKYSATQAISAHLQTNSWATTQTVPVIRLNLIDVSGVDPVIQDAVSHILPSWMNKNSLWNNRAGTGSIQLADGDIIFYWQTYTDNNTNALDSGYATSGWVNLMIRVGVNAGQLVVRWCTTTGTPVNNSVEDYEFSIAEISPTKLAFLGNYHIYEIDATTGLTTFNALTTHATQWNFIMFNDTHFVMIDYMPSNSQYKIGTLNPLTLGTTTYTMPSTSYSWSYCYQDRMNRIGPNKFTLAVGYDAYIRNVANVRVPLYPLLSLDSNGFIQLDAMFSSQDMALTYSTAATSWTYFDVNNLQEKDIMSGEYLYGDDVLIDIGNGKYSYFNIFTRGFGSYLKYAEPTRIAVLHDLKPMFEFTILSGENPASTLIAPNDWGADDVLSRHYEGWGYDDFEYAVRFVNGKYVVIVCDNGGPDDMFMQGQAIIFTVTPPA